MRYRRAEKVAESIKREISLMLQQKEIKDPRIGFVTITRVEISDDLKKAKVYLTHYGKETDKANSFKGLRSAAGFLGKEMGRRLRLKFIPHIEFLYDEKLEKTINVLGIIDSLHSDTHH